MNKDSAYGYFRLDLDRYMQEHYITKYQLCKNANLQPTQLLTYCRNDIQRIDLAVMARICYALNCRLSDIVVYIDPSTNKN